MTERRTWNEALETIAAGPLADLTARLLRDQLDHAVRNSAFYRAQWAASGADPARVRGADDLPLLPFTEKSDLVAAQAAGGPFGSNQTAPARDLVRMQATGGTTGRPLRMAMTRRDVETYNEVGARAAWSAGLRPGDILFECMNYSLYAGGVSDHLTFETVGACVAPISVGGSRRLLEILADLGADAMLYSTPSYARHLAEVAREQHLEPRDLRLRRGLFSGDAGLANRSYRAAIEDTFGLVARNIYGTGETAPIAAECDEADGLHFLGQGAFHPELVEPGSGKPVPFADGAEGELVLTTLTREAHPLVRAHAEPAQQAELVRALTRAVEAADADDSVGAILLRGAGRSFCAGGDLTAMLAMDGDAAAFRTYIEDLQALARAFRRLDVPTIAAVHGHVLAGGFELALACDLRIAADDATFGLPDTALGLSPTSGMTWHLPRVVGEGWARHLLLTGEPIDAATAHRIGLVTRVVPPADLGDAAHAVAETIARHPPVGLAGIRSGLRLASERSFEDALTAELEAEVGCFSTPEFQASLRRFAERHRKRS